MWTIGFPFVLSCVIGVALLASGIGTALATGPDGGGNVAASAANPGTGSSAGVATSDSAAAVVLPDSEDPSGTRPELPHAVAEVARGAARYAVDASREASEVAGAAARVVDSAISEAVQVFRRETSRARAAAERAWEAVDEAADRTTPASEVSGSPARPPGKAQSFRRVQAEASFARGNALLEARKYREARDHFAEAIGLSPEHDRARALLGWSQYFLGDFRDAIVTFKTALRRQPTWEGLYNGLGWSRLRVGRYQLATDAFESALDKNPDYVDALNGLGSVRFERGDYEAALSPFEKALYGYRRLPGPEPAEVMTVRGKMAWSLYYLERYREALAMFIRGSLAAPSSHQFQVGMGWCYLRLGQKADARAAFQRAAKIGPNDEIVREGLRRASL